MSEVVSIHSARSASTDRSPTEASNGEPTLHLIRSGHVPDGEASRIVQRGGRTFEVYGSGEHRPEPFTDGTPAA
jgi:hypothetical protein